MGVVALVRPILTRSLTVLASALLLVGVSLLCARIV
jgi:hypothetical protein